jgi:hypothetical protein
MESPIKNPKMFSEQFRECSRNNLVGVDGPFKSFAEHPELLPFCPMKAKKMLDSGCKGISYMACLKFGGICSSGNIACQKLRGVF